MNRLIDADANIETMKKCAANPESEQALLCYRYTQRILEEAPTVEPAQRWHRVEEPPKAGQNVLTMDSNEDMETATYDEHGYEDSYGFYITNVLYWMPIEPPKEITNE